jgi:hypothetical protein
VTCANDDVTCDNDDVTCDNDDVTCDNVTHDHGKSDVYIYV